MMPELEAVLRPVPPVNPGIYFLSWAGEIVYIGQSWDVATRIEGHRRAGAIRFDAASFIPCPREDLAAAEAALIRSLMPPGNQRRPVGRPWLDRKILDGLGLPGVEVVTHLLEGGAQW